jgi:hypothetical protein
LAQVTDIGLHLVVAIEHPGRHAAQQVAVLVPAERLQAKLEAVHLLLAERVVHRIHKADSQLLGRCACRNQHERRGGQNHTFDHCNSLLFHAFVSPGSADLRGSAISMAMCVAHKPCRAKGRNGVKCL